MGDPDQPCSVGKFLIGCGMGGEVIRLVRCRTGFGGPVTPFGIAGERGVGVRVFELSDLTMLMGSLDWARGLGLCSVSTANTGRLLSTDRLIWISSRDSVDVGGVGNPLSGLMFNGLGRSGCIGCHSDSGLLVSICILLLLLFSFVFGMELGATGERDCPLGAMSAYESPGTTRG